MSCNSARCILTPRIDDGDERLCWCTVAICGPPGGGKTTLSHALLSVVHTDDFMHLSWEEAPHAILEELRQDRTRSVEGVQVARVLRYMAREGDPFRFDAYLWVERGPGPSTPRQRGMAKTIRGIWEEALELLGVEETRLT